MAVKLRCFQWEGSWELEFRSLESKKCREEQLIVRMLETRQKNQLCGSLLLFLGVFIKGNFSSIKINNNLPAHAKPRTRRWAKDVGD